MVVKIAKMMYLWVDVDGCIKERIILSALKYMNVFD